MRFKKLLNFLNLVLLTYLPLMTLKNIYKECKNSKKSLPHRIPDLPASLFLFRLFKDQPAEIKKPIAEAVKILNS